MVGSLTRPGPGHRLLTAPVLEPGLVRSPDSVDDPEIECGTCRVFGEGKVPVDALTGQARADAEELAWLGAARSAADELASLCMGRRIRQERQHEHADKVSKLQHHRCLVSA